MLQLAEGTDELVVAFLCPHSILARTFWLMGLSLAVSPALLITKLLSRAISKD